MLNLDYLHLLKRQVSFKLFCQNIFAVLAFVLVLSGCGTSKITNDCVKFDKGFLEGCNLKCPENCAKVASESNKTRMTFAQIKQICNESCPKHCQKILESVRPDQCKK